MRMYLRSHTKNKKNINPKIKKGIRPSTLDFTLKPQTKKTKTQKNTTHTLQSGSYKDRSHNSTQ